MAYGAKAVERRARRLLARARADRVRAVIRAAKAERRTGVR